MKLIPITSLLDAKSCDNPIYDHRGFTGDFGPVEKVLDRKRTHDSYEFWRDNLDRIVRHPVCVAEDDPDLVTDGHHRIAAAQDQGWLFLPVETYSCSEAMRRFYDRGVRPWPYATEWGE